MEHELQRIVGRILRYAQEDAESIVLEARKSADVMLEQHRELGVQKATERVTHILTKAKDEADSIRGTIGSDMKRRAGWMVLSEKERLMTNVLEEAKARLVALTKTEKYVSELERIVLDGGIALGGGRLQIVLNKHDATLPLNLDAISKTISEKTGNKTELKFSKERIEASGGAVIKTADKRIVLDNTFEAMFKRREKELRLKIAGILFK